MVSLKYRGERRLKLLERGMGRFGCRLFVIMDVRFGGIRDGWGRGLMCLWSLEGMRMRMWRSIFCARGEVKMWAVGEGKVL